MNLAISRLTAFWTFSFFFVYSQHNIHAQENTIWYSWVSGGMIKAKKKLSQAPTLIFGGADIRSQPRNLKCNKGTSLLSICLSGIIATGNFISSGSLMTPSEEKHELIDQTKHSSSRFMTAPSPWIVKPIKRAKLTSRLNTGCVAQGSKVRRWSQNAHLASSGKFPSSRLSKAKVDCINASALMISWGAKTLTGTRRTLEESTCNPNHNTCGCSCNPHRHLTHRWRSRSAFWGCLPSQPRELKARIAECGSSWSWTIPCAISHAEATLTLPLPTNSASFPTVFDSPKSSNLGRFLTWAKNCWHSGWV